MERASNQTVEGLYLPSLDGLRFLAFSLVLVHHMPELQGGGILAHIKAYGWVGVELFFVISAFLFFYLLDAEMMKTKRVSYIGFYIRRFLRIYPLMIGFPILMFAMYGSQNDLAWYRLAGIAILADNMIAWIANYNSSILYVAHLWTLSFEFQIYIIIPIAYGIYAATGKKVFTNILISSLLLAVSMRIVFYGIGASHPVIWVTPFLRPESIILGILLSIWRPTWRWQYSAIIAVASATAFFSTTVPWESMLGNIVQYPLAAIMCASTVDAALRSEFLRSALSTKPMAFLGTISFGLYIVHFWAIHLSKVLTDSYIDPYSKLDHLTRYFILTVLALLISVAIATISYNFVEKPFLLLKKRFSSVDGRAQIKSAQLAQGM